MPHRLAWPDVPPRVMLFVPTGSFEQHGPHLPLHTDAVIATAVAERAAGILAASGPVVVGPPLAYGASGEHQDFPGTVSIGTAALRFAIVELARSASSWAERIVFVNGHGGNVAALAFAVRHLRDEGQDVGWVPCATPDGDAHAGHVETSVMLYLAADQVEMARAVAGNREPVERLMPSLVAGGVAAASPTGVLGDPSVATAGEGARLLASMVDAVVAGVRSGHPDAHGCLALAEVRRP